MRASLKAGIVAGFAIVLGITAVLLALSYGSLFWGAIALVAYILFFGFAAMVVSSGLLIGASIIVPLMFSFYFLPRELTLWSVGLVGVLVALGGVWQIGHEKKTNPGANTRKLLRTVLPPFFTVLSLIITLFYYAEVRNVQEIVLVPRKAFDIGLPYLGEVFRSAIPLPERIDPNATIDDLLYKLVGAELASAKKPADIKTFPELQIQAYIKEQRRALATTFGITLHGGERLGDVFYDVANKKATELAGSYIQWWGVIIALGVFLGLKTLSFPFYWLTILVDSLLFWCAQKTHFLYKKEETITIIRYFI